MRRGIDGVESLRLLAGNTFAAQDVGHADDAVHRRAYFVAHVGEEGALGDACGFGGFLGSGQLDRTRCNQSRKLVTMHFEFGYGLMALSDIHRNAERQPATIRHRPETYRANVPDAFAAIAAANPVLTFGLAMAGIVDTLKVSARFILLLAIGSCGPIRDSRNIVQLVPRDVGPSSTYRDNGTIIGMDHDRERRFLDSRAKAIFALAERLFGFCPTSSAG